MLMRLNRAATFYGSAMPSYVISSHLDFYRCLSSSILSIDFWFYECTSAHRILTDTGVHSLLGTGMCERPQNHLGGVKVCVSGSSS